MKWAALFGVARWPRAVAWLLAMSGAVAAGAFAAGMQWESGRVARQDLESLRQIVAQSEDVLARQQAAARQAAEARQAQRDWHTERRRELEEWVNANPELVHCHIGSDGLRLWQWWNHAATHGSD